MFSSAGCSLLRAEGFFCSLEILYGGLGIVVFDIKNLIFFSSKFVVIFGHQNPGSRLGPESVQYSAYNAGPGSVSNEQVRIRNTAYNRIEDT